jgi:hypothetical protein
VAVQTQPIVNLHSVINRRGQFFLFINFCEMDVWIFCCECQSCAFELYMYVRNYLQG